MGTVDAMTIQGEYAPSPSGWVRDQVELYESSGGTEGKAREVHGDEKAEWWQRAVEAFPDYADYQQKTDREIPLFVLEPVEG
jgi:deazaflavin-dependent oxidoreductase (nitroreductase family)